MSNPTERTGFMTLSTSFVGQSLLIDMNVNVNIQALVWEGKRESTSAALYIRAPIMPR
jgi:hypothetical protein